MCPNPDCGIYHNVTSTNQMPSLKMKSKASSCLTERKDVHVCPKSKVISKKPCSKIIFPDQVEERDATIENCLDVSSRMLVSPKDVASCESIDRKDVLNKENSESQQQQSFSPDSSALGKMESTDPCTANIETILSPAFEPIEVHSQHYNQEDAVGSSDDTDMPRLSGGESDEGRSICGYETCDVSDFYISDMPRLSGGESDEGRSICGYETCDVSDFYISDMIVSNLPLDGDYFDDDICEINCLSDYKSSVPTIFDVSDQYMLLPVLEDDVKVGSTEDNLSCEESMMVQENVSLYSALCQIRSCNWDSDLKNEFDKTECFDPQLFILPELSDLESNDLPLQMPKQSQRRKAVTLVLDLDETLVHSTLEHCDDADFTFNVFFNMKEHTVYVKQRPNLHTFLERVSEMFEVVIFTASQSIYAKQLIDILDPDGRLISRQVYRESCIFSDGTCTKDLTVLGVDLAKVVIIDNSPQVFRLQVNNGIPIKSWFDDPLDCALMSLLPFLEILANADDVRPIIAQRFGNKE